MVKEALLSILRFIYLKGYWLFGRQAFKRLPLIRTLNRGIVGAFKNRVALVDGHRMHIDEQDSLRLSLFGTFEPNETRLVKENIKPGDRVLDIGAHIGYYTLQFARLVGAEGHVYAFEPDPENFRLLERNIAENRYSNVTLVSKAVADRSGKGFLYRSATNSGDHRLCSPPERRDKVEVETVAIDDYFGDERPRIDFIKMDIQGSEGWAVRGMKELIRRSESLMLMTEWSPGALKSSGFQPREYIDLLIEVGFRIHLVEDHRFAISPVEPEELAALDGLANLFCTKGEGP